MFHSVSRKFSFIKPSKFSTECPFFEDQIEVEQDAYCVGNSVVVFSSAKNSFVVYDLVKNE